MPVNESRNVLILHKKNLVSVDLLNIGFSPPIIDVGIDLYLPNENNEVSILYIGHDIYKDSDDFAFFCTCLTNFTQLKQIKLSGSWLANLTSVQLQSFFISLQTCSYLTTLIIETGLEFISDQQWSEICLALCQCKQLTTLKLSKNEFSKILEQEWCALFSGLEKHCPQIIELNLSASSLNEISQPAWQSFVSGLQQCKQLQLVNLSHNELGKIQPHLLHSLFLSLSNLPELQMLDFSYNELGDLPAEDWQQFFSYIKEHSNLNSLNLESNGFKNCSDLYWPAFFNQLSTCQSLTDINFSTNNLIQLPKDSSLSFFTAIQSCTQLVKLNFKNNLIGHITNLQWYFFSHLKHLTQMTTLHLTQNLLGDIFDNNKWKAFFISIEHCENLHTLDLSENSLYKLSLPQLLICFAGLQRCTQLTTLKLSANKLYMFANFIYEINFFDQLNKYTHLTALDLSVNGLGSLSVHSIKLFAECLTNLFSLTKLDLSSNHLNEFTHNHWYVFFAKLQSCQNLKELILKDNTLGTLNSEQWFQFLTGLQQCKYLSKLDLSNNKFAALSVNHWAVFLTHLSRYLNLVSVNLQQNQLKSLVQVTTQTPPFLGKIVFSSNDINNLMITEFDQFCQLFSKTYVVVPFMNKYISCPSNIIQLEQRTRQSMYGAIYALYMIYIGAIISPPKQADRINRIKCPWLLLDIGKRIASHLLFNNEIIACLETIIHDNGKQSLDYMLLGAQDTQKNKEQCIRFMWQHFNTSKNIRCKQNPTITLSNSSLN